MKKENQRGGTGKFWSGAEAAVSLVIIPVQLLESLSQQRDVRRERAALDARASPQDLRQPASGFPYPLGVGAPVLLDPQDQIPEPVARDVRSSEERMQVRRQEERHGPATAARHGQEGAHIDAVDIRTLLPVHLDIDEMPIHQRCRFLILEHLSLHDVAPVAGGVTDREKDEPVFKPCPRECLLAPGMPLDRVERMLKKVRALFVN